MAQTQPVPQSDGDLEDPEPGSPSETGRQSDVPGSDREAFRRFQQFMRMEQTGRGRLFGPQRQRRGGERDDEDDDDAGEGRGQAGPPPTWDGETAFEDYHIKAKLWIATTKARPKMRGPLLLKSLTSTPFEVYKHYAKDTSWLNDPQNAEKLLDDMNRPDRYGEDQQEHMLTAMSRITFHLRRHRGESWREFFSRWDTALRKVHQHSIHFPEEYEGFLLINGLQLTDAETKSLLNFNHGCIKPATIKSWLRKNETKLLAAELGADKDRKKTTGVNYMEKETYYMDDESGMNLDEDSEAEAIHELETYVTELQGGREPGDEAVLSESEAAEILSTFLHQKKKTYTESIKNKAKELARGYGLGRRDQASSAYRAQRPIRPGSYSVTIAELQKRTRCNRCHQIGHWKRDCKNPPAKRTEDSVKTNETNYLENTEEVFFAGFIDHIKTNEKDPNYISEEHFAPHVQADVDISCEPNAVGSVFDQDILSTEAYKDSDQGWEGTVFSERSCCDSFCSDSLFIFENWMCSLVKSQHAPDDYTSATVDTGCQRLAIGARTLIKFKELLPEILKVTLQRQVNRFRSVHQTSTTTRVANIPCSLGQKGSFLKPAVFENPESDQAPFLISLSFLIHCKGSLNLDVEKGLQLSIHGMQAPMQLYLGPTGALRIPLQQFNPEQLEHLVRLQESPEVHSQQEFEILKLNHSDVNNFSALKPCTSHSVAPNDSLGTSVHGATKHEAISGRPNATKSGLGLMDQNDEKALLHANPRAVHVGTADRPAQTSQKDDTPGHEGDERGRPEGDHPGGPRRDLPAGDRGGLERRLLHREHATERDDSKLFNGQGKPTHSGQGESWGHCGTLSDFRRTPSLPVRADSPIESQLDKEQLRKVLPSLPEERDRAMPILSVDRTATLAEPGELAISPSTRREREEPCRDPEGNHSEPLQSSTDQQEGYQRLHESDQLQRVPQESEQGVQDSSQGQVKTEVKAVGREGRSGVPGLPGVPEVQGVAEQKALKPVPAKLERKIKAAIRGAVSFWRQIQLILSQHGQENHVLSDLMHKFNSEICQEFTMNPTGSKRTHEIASLMGISNGQLKTVAEIYNPNCFGKIAKRFQLIPGRAFDLTLGDDLLQNETRQTVRDYIIRVRPGLVIVSPPCHMYSMLQNLMKNKREKFPEMMNQYLKRKRDSDKLLVFAVEICELCLSLGIHFVLEHPYSASSWKHRAMEKLLKRSDTFLAKTDQCCFGLKSQQGQPHQKPTGFLSSSSEIAQQLHRKCQGEHQHEHIIGGHKSRRTQEYPEELRAVILRTYSKMVQAEVHVLDSTKLFQSDRRIDRMLQKEFRETRDQGLPDGGAELLLGEHPEDEEDEPPLEDPEMAEFRPLPEEPQQVDPGEPQEAEIEAGYEGKNLPLSQRFTTAQLLQRAHEGLGHPSPDRFLRILRYAKAKPEILQAAKDLRCSVCLRHSQVRPTRRSAPTRELSFNECVGVDVVYLPTLRGKTRPSLNITDWGTKFQLVIPMESKKPAQVREAYRHWLRIFGPPKKLAIDLGKEFKGEFAYKAEQDGSYVDPAAVETPQQRSITERHGKTFKYILLKAMDTYNCETMQEWEDLVDVTSMTKNRMMSVSGFSPFQRVIGFNPVVPGNLLSGNDGRPAEPPNPKVGDLAIERSMKMRMAASQAFLEADASNSLRRAITSGPRPLVDYEIGEMVYFFRMGANKRLKFDASYWQGPARVVMTDPPNTIRLSYQGHLVKASPERIRRASTEENMAMSQWLEDIVKLRKDLTTEPTQGYIDLSGEPLPQPLEDGLSDDDYEPSILGIEERSREYPPPTKRYRIKGPQENLREPDPLQPEELEPPELPGDEPLGEDQGEEHGNKRELEEPDQESQPSPMKRSRIEYLEIYHAKVENLMRTRQRKEVRLKELNLKNQKCFEKAIAKEIKNNVDIGAYRFLSVEESAEIRRTMPEKIMESRLVLTPKPLEPHEVEQFRQEGLLLEWEGDEPCKAKARHVMKGYSEDGADEIEATTPQVTREGVLLVTQLIASSRWKIGFLDFTQAFHSGDKIDRIIFATQPREGVPGYAPSQLIKLEKVCYGLTDGPLAWFRHLRKFLMTTLGYQQSIADPCIYFKNKWDPITKKNKLSGVIAVATDDLIHGGDEEHHQAMEQIKLHYKLGKYQFSAGRFTGKQFQQHEDYSITINQEHYVGEKIFEIDIEKSRKKQRYSYCTESEISQLRASLGALSWLAKESRPDLTGRVALLQQVFPRPRVRDLIEANSIAQEAKRYASSGIKIMPIPLENLRVGVATDASWSNARDRQQTEGNTRDFWEETPSHWIRHHIEPRRTTFHPGAAEGPDLHDLQPSRRTVTSTNEVKEDEWTKGNSVFNWLDETWTGKTFFSKQPPGHKLAHGEINEAFIKMLNCSSQGGFVMMFYDKRLELEKQPHIVSVTSWKSTRLKRKTVNTLSAECQSLVTGIGQIHWHRFLLLEILGENMNGQEWEKKLAAIPYVSVVDSRSLYDCMNKLVCTFSQVEDKRTAIDIAILKDDLYKTGGNLRWVAGSNMVADPMTKRMNSSFLRKICNEGFWSLSEAGHQRQCLENDVLLVMLYQ